MTTKRRRQFTANFKKRVALEALRGDRPVQAIAAKHEIHPNQVGVWKRQAVDRLEEVFAGSRASRESEHETTIRDLQLGADAETIHAYASRQQTVSEHQQRIGQYLRLRAFDAAADERLVRFLEAEALRLDRTASLLARARAWRSPARRRRHNHDSGRKPPETLARPG